MIGRLPDGLVPDGTAALYEAIANDIAGEVVLGDAVEAVRADGDRVTVITAGADHEAKRAVITVPSGVLPGIEFTPPLAPAKRDANHAGQGIKACAIARGVPDDLFAIGHGTLLDFAGAMESTPDGVLLVCFGPSAAGLDVADDAAVAAAVRELAPEGPVHFAGGRKKK